MKRRIKAVIDRFEEDKAVLLLGESAEPLIVGREQLPSGAREGHWLRVDIGDDPPYPCHSAPLGRKLLYAEIDEEETANAEARIADKLAKLRSGAHRKRKWWIFRR